MKKLAAILFTMIVVLALISAGYAYGESTEVSMVVGDLYSYSVPEAVSMTKAANGSGNVVFNVTNLEAGHSLSVSLSGRNYFDDSSHCFSLNSDGTSDSIPYQIKIGDNPIDSGASFATIDTLGVSTIQLIFSARKDQCDVAAGRYSDTITYTVSVNS